MRYFPVVALLFVLTYSAQGQEDNVLDPASMRKGETGKLPRATNKTRYVVADTLDDEVLVTQQFEGKIVARFFLRDKEAVAHFKRMGNGGNGKVIELPHVYAVVGFKTLDRTLPVIAFKRLR